MPTTRFKNMVYRAELPLRAPRLERSPELQVSGEVRTLPEYIGLLRKNHVLGSSLLLKGGDRRAVVLCSSGNPPHPVREDSLYRVASITKMAASLAALAAVSEGKLDPESPVLPYFSGVSDIPSLRDVTLLHLLSHTSGLKDPPNLENALLAGKTFLEILKQDGTRVSPPGSEFHYSNLGFGLIGCLLEAVYDLPIPEIMDRLVFAPLGMNAYIDASALNPDRIVPITRILPYRPGSDLLVTPLGKIPLNHPDPLRHYGHTAGAMYLDLRSLEKLTDCLQAGGAPLIPPELGSGMTRKHASYGKISPTLSYGLGMLIIRDSTLSEGRILGHQGFAYGCADGAFWEENSGRTVLFLNGGASEARKGRLGLCNYDVLRWALRKEMPEWSGSMR